MCEILANGTMPSPRLLPDARLVLSAPPGTVPLADRERLDGFVLDVIRQATTSLAIGGAFWNEAGFELLDDVLLPAVQVRGIATTVYVNTPERDYLAPLQERLATLRSAGPVRVRWFVGARPTMLHAKFVIRDNVHGYLGTANLTSWGLHGHIEAGVELTAGQSQRFVQFLDERTNDEILTDRGEFVDDRETEAAFYQRQRLIRARDIHDRFQFHVHLLARPRDHRAERNVAPE